MTDVQLELAEAQAHDSDSIDKRLTSLENKMDIVLENNIAMTSKLNETVGKSHKYDLIISVIKSKIFLYGTLIIVASMALGGRDFIDRIWPRNVHIPLMNQEQTTNFD